MEGMQTHIEQSCIEHFRKGERCHIVTNEDNVPFLEPFHARSLESPDEDVGVSFQMSLFQHGCSTPFIAAGRNRIAPQVAAPPSLLGAEDLFDLGYVGAFDNLPVDHEEGRADRTAPGLLSGFLVDLE